MKATYNILFFLLIISGISYAQKDLVKNNGQTIYYYNNGEKASEGFIRNGNPDGYWKTYYQNGKLKSEGNRKNFQIDSTWNFYNSDGKLTMKINYKDGKKNGIRRTVRKEKIVDENFVDDIKQGVTTYYYIDGKLWMTINYVNGQEQGLCKEYAPDSTVIALIQYKNGFVINREIINRRDKNNLKQNTWKEFYDNGNIKQEGTYRNNKKNGYFKEYSIDGKLLSIVKYIDDELQKDVKELVSYDIKTEYYPNGAPKVTASYKNNIMEGVRRDYSVEGKIIKSYIYENDIIIGDGIIDEKGLKQGRWKEYYETGQLKSEGQYEDNKKLDDWKYYYKNKNIEEEGAYLKDEKPDGIWKWYYENGKLLREQNFINGLEDGLMTEYSDSGTVISKGKYIEGYEEGLWVYNVGDYKEEGNYKEGRRTGEWKQYYNNKKLKLIGNFIDDFPDGKHIYYWDNGKLQEERKYVMGKKEGNWKFYNYDGTLFLTILFRNGVEVRYDNVVIRPALDADN